MQVAVTVTSQTRRGIFYTITQRVDGAYRCSCPDSVFRNKVCKHIRTLASQLVAR